MKIILTVFIALLFISKSNAQNNIQYFRNDTIPVYRNADTLMNPWGGGLNFCQFSSIDLNLDGKDDLFVFDKTGDRISTYVNEGASGEIKYKHAPQYIQSFPVLTGWAVLRDYNCDGMADIFTFGSGPMGGIDIYENTSSITSGLQFQLKVHLVKANMAPNSTNFYDDIKITSIDVPAIRDIDGDNDLDILTFDVGGTTVEWFRNMSTEITGNCDSIIYTLETGCWGEFTENTLNASVTLNTPCAPPPVMDTENQLRTERHAGSCMECIFTDGDTDPDLLVGDISNAHVTYLRNGSGTPNAVMNFADAVYPAYDTNVFMNIFICPYRLDVNNDGIQDLIFSPNASSTVENYRSCWLYLNSGSNDSTHLAFQQKDFLQDNMIEVGEGAVPRFHDYDNDGDADLFIGNYGYYSASGIYPSKIALYKNVGNFNTPVFQWITDDFASLYANAYNIISPVPAFADLDGDGDKDMLVGDFTGKLHFFRKDAGPADNFVLATPNYQGIDVGNNATPQLIDVDRDGKTDLLIGEQSGNVNYYRNTSTTSTPVFTLVTANFGGIDVQAPSFITGYSVPCMYDNNGSYVLLVGSERGYIYRYDNIDGNLSGSFTLTDSTYITTREGMRVAPWAAYVNGDTIIDIAIGNYSGGMAIYTGDLISSVAEISNQEITTLVSYPNPATNSIQLSGWNRETQFPVVVQIFNAAGVLIDEQNLVNSEQPLNTSAYSAGYYFASVRDKDALCASFRFVITESDER
jgi:hypothetical protein